MPPKNLSLTFERNRQLSPFYGVFRVRVRVVTISKDTFVAVV